MKRICISSLLLVSVIFCHAQNMVMNGDFEFISKKPKSTGMIHLADHWLSPTNAPANLYSTSAKDDRIKVPKNEYGDEKPKKGESYAGLLLYSYNERQPRTYLTSKLTSPLEKGEWYCVRFHVSLADMAKYACDNIGLYLSKDSVYQEGTGILNFEPQIIHSTNRIFERQWDWEPICRIYVAEGGEEYITIGNFEAQAKVLTKKVKRPKGYTSAQKPSAFYYVDNISVKPHATRTNCKCEKGNFAFAHLDKQEKSFDSNADDAPKPVYISSAGRVNNTTKAAAAVKEDIVVPFALAKSAITANAKAKLDETIKFLKANTDVRIEVIAHIDKTEIRVPDLSQKRLNEVKKYLLSQGVNKTKMTASSVGETKPLDNSGLKENRLKNTVVEIKFSK